MRFLNQITHLRTQYQLMFDLKCEIWDTICKTKDLKARFRIRRDDLENTEAFCTYAEAEQTRMNLEREFAINSNRKPSKLLKIVFEKYYIFFNFQN